MYKGLKERFLLITSPLIIFPRVLLKITTLLGWSVAAVVAMLLVYGPHKSILPGAEEWNEAENVLFGTFRRFLWGLVLAWVTYACHYGAGGL